MCVHGQQKEVINTALPIVASSVTVHLLSQSCTATVNAQRSLIAIRCTASNLEPPFAAHSTWLSMQNSELSRRKMIASIGLLAGTCNSQNAAEGPLANSASAMTTTAKAVPLTFSTYGLPTLSLNQAIEAIGGHGYDGLEINVASTSRTATEKLTTAQRKEARKRLNDRGMVIGSLMSHLQPLSSRERHNEGKRRLERDCILARELAPDSPPVIQTILGGKNWGDSKQQCVDRLADWVSIAEEHGVVVAVKPHRGHAMSRPSEAAWLIAQLDHPKLLRMWFDYSHFIFRDIPLKQSLQQSLPIMAGVAVKDAIEKEGRVQFLLPGAAGTIDYELLCTILREGNFSGSLCVEVSSHVWKRPDYDPTVAMRESYDVLSSAMGTKNSSRNR